LRNSALEPGIPVTIQRRARGDVTSVRITDGLSVGDGHPLAIIAGPCVLESLDATLRLAQEIRNVCDTRGLGIIFKASFDKANRSSSEAPRGPGIERGLAVLARVKEEIGLPVTTDIHETWQTEPVAEVVDVLQIPAFLSRQTDLLMAAAATGLAVNVKKGQFLSPPEMANVVKKLETGGARRILLTERGTTFGYHNLVVDFRSLPQLRALGWPVVFDATHSVQMPGGLGTRSGGQRDYAPYLARAAVAVGIDALFVEVHEEPDSAPSDGPNMLRLESLGPLLDDLLALHSATASDEP
jgi:2-dehydro-3-deoxyphosphooctonate aldolase (KDO 8-P synthase)